MLKLVSTDGWYDATHYVYSPIAPDRFEQFQRFAQSVLTGVFTQNHIIGRTGRHKNDCCDIIETLDPFSSFLSLTTNIEHVKLNFVHTETRLKYSRGEDTATQNILHRTVRKKSLKN